MLKIERNFGRFQSGMKAMWDQRYSDKSYVYGTEPNDFLRESAQQIPKGKILCLAEGEGRNAVWLA